MEMFRKDTPRSNEIMELEWRDAEALWRARQSVAPPVGADDITAIDDIFYVDKKLRDPDWTRINEAERRLALVITESQLTTQYLLLLNIARRRSLQSLATYPDRSAFTLLSVDEKRNTYGSLLYELQAGFIEGRFIRRLRREVADTLWLYGLGIVVASLLIPCAWVFLAWLRLPPPPRIFHIDETIFALLAVASAGGLGAFFSRAMRFQAELSSLSFESVTQNYVGQMLRLRILYGVIGSIVFYFAIRGTFIAGNLFPTIQPGMISQQMIGLMTLFDNSVQLTTAAVAGLSPAGEFAKLLVWSFLAGFSERLVPDALSQLEKKSEDALRKEKVP